MLTCLATVLIGFSTPMTDLDKQTLKTATKGCQRIYLDAPCLAKLIKKEEAVYSAICGPKVKK
jgi:hypothetical protein